VQRNRAKRLLREAYRALAGNEAMQKGFLIVLAARDAIVGCREPEVEAELSRAFKRLKLLP